MQKGFFTGSLGKTKHKDKGRSYTCVSCGLNKDCETPMIPTNTEEERDILIVLPPATASEDSKGIPGSGRDNRKLKDTLLDFGINVDKDCILINSVRCHARSPKLFNVECCQKHIQKLIKQRKPKLILTVGEEATHSVLSTRWSKGGTDKIEQWRGFQIPDQEFCAYVCPIYSASHVSNSDKVVEVIWRKDIEKAVETLKIPFPVYKHPEIEYITDLSILDEIDTDTFDLVAIDYETTGLKPHGKGHRIICASVSINPQSAMVFMLPDTKEERAPFLRLLENKGIGKIAHNMKYEDIWSNVRLKQKVNGWHWDSMIAAHILDNRPGICSLKLQAYLNFGVVGYDDEVAPYLVSGGKDNNALNDIGTLIQNGYGREQLMKYCGYDTALTYALYEKQQKEMDDDDMRAYELFHKGIEAFSRAEQQGLRIDTDYAERQEKKLEKRIKRIEKTLEDSKFYRRWKHIFGRVNIDSPDQLQKYLYGTLKLTPMKTTAGGKGSTDEESLRFLQIPELDMLLDARELKKAKNTYLKAFTREQVRGFMHPSFSLHTVTTYRSSSQNPNFQNIPKRNKAVKKLIRDSIFPRKGNQFLAVDFSGIEVSIAACYHKDPTMIKYRTGHGDMHGDMAKQIFCIQDWSPDLEYHSLLRNAAKNGFVFPQFYGDYYANNAAGLCKWVNLPHTRWKDDMGVKVFPGKTISTQLIENGIGSYSDFVDHLKKIEKDFWTRRFPVYNKWKKKMFAEYEQQGFIKSKTGFTFKKEMARNQAINYPVQGAAFHCLLWAFIEIDKYIMKKNLQSRLVGQIHDEVVLDVYPPELEELSKVIQIITTKKLQKAWDWINIPLEVDAELAGIDESWHCMQKYKLPK